MQRWSNHVAETLRTFVRRGGLFLLGAIAVIVLTLSPMMTRPANAQITDLLGMGGSFTNGLSNCAIETVGWVICPTMRSIAKLADYGWTYVNSNFLRVDSNISNTGSGTYKAWELMRSVANALFVVAFMILVYSQLTGRNSGGYNIKRLLPRLIIAAIAVNLSYFICAILIEASNIVGDSLIQVFKEVAGRVGRTIMPIETKPSAFQDGTLTVITTSVMSKTGTAWVLLAPVAAVVITIATITGAALVLLIMRKAVIAMLVLASPILFVAYLLPNLERFFFQGVRLFIQLLLLFPIIALLLGAGQIVSATIVTVGSNDANYRVTGDSYFSRSGGSGSAITDLTAAAAAVLPLLGVWFVFKNMSSIMSTAGARLSANISGRRGGKDEAQVTGKAPLGAAANQTPKGLPNNFGDRKQGFNRNRRRSTMAGSALTAENMASAKRDTGAGQAALDASLRGKNEDLQSKMDSQQEAALNADSLSAEQIAAQEQQKGMGDMAATAILGAKGREDKGDEKQVTAKDLFNELNKNRMGGAQSKDKQRQFSAGPTAGGGNGSGDGGGSATPSAPVVAYSAPQIAQGGNIVSGSAAGAAPTPVIAVPVQIDASALLGGKNAMQQPPNGVAQTPVSGTEEKAKARAQKYMFDSQKEIDEAEDKMDIIGKPKGADEPPHTNPHKDDE